MDEIVGALRFLCAQRVADGVWRISLPTLINTSNARAELVWAIACVSEVAPHRVIWLSDWTTNEAPIVKEIPRNKAILFDAELDLGGWALLFFDSDKNEKSLRDFPTAPNAGADAVALLDEYGAKVGIWSWYDNAEWLMAVTD